MAALLPLHPRFALHPQHPSLDQSIDELATFKNLYLVTDLGRLDILGAIPNGTFAEMAPTAVEMEVAGVRCAILGLDELIASKEALGREKDKLSELELRAIRDRLRAPTLGAREDRDDS
ncbi:MAG: hypothetical protein EP329_27100 [Deltaproteobacteria bacterium]|nr:MAG: hypothetical protein EP329_27100 [Deltaproteobacteria bacterium]